MILDALTIGTRAGFYLSVLLAAGSVLCFWLLSTLPTVERRLLRLISPIAAGLASIFAAAGIALEAIFLAGGDWAAVFDGQLIGFILDGPKGHALAVLVPGLVALSLLFFNHRGTEAISLLGVLAIAASFGLTGHTWAAEGWLLNGLVMLHVLFLGFWLGVFLPLYQISRRDPAAASVVAHQFGRQAIWAVGSLAVAGLITLHQLTGGLIAALATDYGRLFALKLILFVLVMGFAAYNRLSLTPALMHAPVRAVVYLRRSLIMEGGLILAILLVTATATTLTGPSPPGG